MDPDRVWTHLSEDQAEGLACVMCRRPTTATGWSGVQVGLSPDGSPVYACAPGGRIAVAGDSRGRLVPVGPGPTGSTCAEQAGGTVPDSPEELGR